MRCAGALGVARCGLRWARKAQPAAPGSAAARCSRRSPPPCAPCLRTGQGNAYARGRLFGAARCWARTGLWGCRSGGRARCHARPTRPTPRTFKRLSLGRGRVLAGALGGHHVAAQPRHGRLERQARARGGLVKERGHDVAVEHLGLAHAGADLCAHAGEQGASTVRRRALLHRLTPPSTPPPVEELRP